MLFSYVFLKKAKAKAKAEVEAKANSKAHEKCSSPLALTSLWNFLLGEDHMNHCRTLTFWSLHQRRGEVEKG